MHRKWFPGTVMALATVVVMTSVASGQATKGQVTAGAHEYEMKANSIYAIRVEGKDFQPRVAMVPGFLPFVAQDFKMPNKFVTYYAPTKDEKNTILVVPELYNIKGKGPFEYEIEIKPVTLNEKPVVDVKAELTANDPAFKDEFGSRPHHKGYDLKVKANEFYIIDMKEPVRAKLDSFLYLLDSKGKVVRSDDDSGGFPSARIVFQAPQDGDYRIICTGLGQALGAFQLTVRTSEKK